MVCWWWDQVFFFSSPLFLHPHSVSSRLLFQEQIKRLFREAPSHIRCLRHSLDNDSLLDRVSTRHDTSDAPSEPLVCGRGLLVSLLFFPFGGQMQRPPLIWTCDSLSKAFLFRSKIMKHECPSLPTVMKKPLLWTHEPRGHFNQTGIQAAAGKQLSILDWPKSQ